MVRISAVSSIPMKIALLVLALVVGCTKENAAFCCIDPADCAAQGVDESRLCTDGLSCVNNTCVASTCATTGCAAAAPVCEIATDMCVGCADSTDCTRFPATDVCSASGACVECVSNMDCDPTRPVCDAMACRTCKLDTECPSAACGEDGACVPEANVVYLSPTGTDAVPCARALPCQQLSFAIRQTTISRNHLVFALGTYEYGSQPLIINSAVTSSNRIVVHGGGSTLTGGSSDGGLMLYVPATLRDLVVINSHVGSSQALYFASAGLLERVRLRGHNGLAVAGQVTAKELIVNADDQGISNTGALTLDVATIAGGTTAIWSRQGSLDITNLLTFGTTGIALDIDGSGGSMAFSTVYSTAQGTDPGGVRCAIAPFTIRASIVWTPSAPTTRPGITGSCMLNSTIAGPLGVVGAMNSDPLFVNPTTNDFHLSGASPARDVIDMGPTGDFEGDPRPRRSPVRHRRLRGSVARFSRESGRSTPPIP